MQPSLTVRDIRAIGVEVPMTYALGTSRGAITKAPLLLIDVDTEEGVTGRAYLWCYLPEAMPAIASILGAVRDTLKGDPLAPVDLYGKLSRRFALIGVQGIVRMALAGFDMAAWDALARAAQLPLVRELAVPIQIGENFSESDAMLAALDAGACDYVMPDLERIGGVTGWLRAAALAATRRMEMSSHLFPEISAHLLAATPTCHYLEYVDWADKILEEPLRIENGFAIIPDRPGNGMAWNTKAVERFRA